MRQITLVFVHGYSVTNINTYGELPLRLLNEGYSRGIEIKTENIFLGRYISFNDEVRLNDISKALETAVQQQIVRGNTNNSRFIFITHSTGGPVVRNWWDIYYKNNTDQCPMSHLIMLAPANFGSALAQLGKGKLSRLKSWFDGVQPGQGVLNWLELGSSEAWELNSDWIKSSGTQISEHGIFPFVVIGQDIDRKLYDHLNSYTGEIGSDGVVRSAAANLNSRYIKLAQPDPQFKNNKFVTDDFIVESFHESPNTAMRIVSGKSHSGDDMGIMKSVDRATDDKSAEIVRVIFDCIAIQTTDDYLTIIKKFDTETNQVQKDSLVETEKGIFKSRAFIHDRYSMIIFKVKDSEGYALTNFDLILTAGENNDPNALPPGFFADRQCNHLNQSSITYFFNYDIMNGTPAIVNANGEVIRTAIVGIEKLGLIIKPRPEDGFIRYLPCKINATKELFDTALKPNSTTLIEIVLQRIVSTEVFRFEKLNGDSAPEKNFANTDPGKDII
jgi:hypothetical protein